MKIKKFYLFLIFYFMSIIQTELTLIRKHFEHNMVKPLLFIEKFILPLELCNSFLISFA